MKENSNNFSLKQILSKFKVLLIFHNSRNYSSLLIHNITNACLMIETGINKVIFFKEEKRNLKCYTLKSANAFQPNSE